MAIDTKRTPLVPADVDLRDFPFTPIFRSRLFGSTFHANADDAEWRAGVTLWLKSWDQVPAGTLPDDDVALCRLAELGRDLRTWRKVKPRALHGWHLCTDGRMHHAVVAEGVLEAWEKRRKNKQRGLVGASVRWGTSNASTNASASQPDSQSTLQAMLVDGKGEGQGERREVTPLPPKRKTTLKQRSQAPAPAPSGGSKNGSSTEQDFELFYTTFPRHDDRRRALKAWPSALKRAGSLTKILAGAQAYADERKADIRPGAGKFTKLAATWLNGDCWENGAKTNGHAGDEWAMSEEDLLLAKIFGGIATDTLIFKRGKTVWPEAVHGPAPSDPKTKIDPVVLSRHGYADANIYEQWKQKNSL